MSFGGPADSLMPPALNYAAKKGVTLIAAAGNSGPGAVSYPASYPNVISIGATTNKDVWASFSNTNVMVDFSAPGVDIYSTLPTYPVSKWLSELPANYGYLSGTSMASPMAAGAAALILAKDPTLTPIEVEKLLEKTAEDLGDVGWDEYFGFGRLDTARALNSLDDTVAPTANVTTPYLSTKSSNTLKFKVSWSATDPAPASGVVSYDIQYRLGSTGSWTDWLQGTQATSAYFSQGKAGGIYYFRARAKDLMGNVGAWSTARATVVPYDNNSLIHKRFGFNSVYTNTGKGFYLGTIRYSAGSGQTIIYKFYGKKVFLLGTKAKNRSKARIYVDNTYKTTVDAYSSSLKFRNVLYSKAWGGNGVHYLKIVNLGTPGRKVFDVDGLAIVR